jgi:hypothetical protein
VRGPLVCRPGAGLVCRVSDRPMSERYRDLVQRRASGAWPPKPSMQSVTYLAKYERPDIVAILRYGALSQRRAARAGAVTPDFAAHAERACWRREASRTKSMMGDLALCRQEPAAKDGLRAHDRPRDRDVSERALSLLITDHGPERRDLQQRRSHVRSRTAAGGSHPLRT